MMPTSRLPTDAEIQELDDALTAEGVPAHDRPDRAMFRWAQKVDDYPLGLVETAAWFARKFEALHPSVNFKERPFAYFCVSAQSIAYALDPPYVIGRAAVNPLRSIRIQPVELDRIHKRYPEAFWEMFHQAVDGCDLYMAQMNFAPQAPLGHMTSVGYSHLEASARQLVAGTIDASLAHSVCTAVETVSKGVLASVGTSEADLKKLSHHLEDVCAAVARALPATNDAEYLSVAKTIPGLVNMRYGGSSGLEEHDLYRRGLFLCAEALRRTNHDQLRSKVDADPSVPRRQW